VFKFAKIALFTMTVVVGAVSTPAFAASERGAATGEALAREILKLMDTDKNGKVSRQEFMRFMEAEFDRLGRRP
jgi:Ca2+-binding EF-hand superfamily protein